MKASFFKKVFRNFCSKGLYFFKKKKKSCVTLWENEVNFHENKITEVNIDKISFFRKKIVKNTFETS